MGDDSPGDRPLEASFTGEGAAAAAKAAERALAKAMPDDAEIEAKLDDLELRAVARAERMDALLGAVEAAVDAVVAAAGEHGAGVEVRAESEEKPAKEQTEDA
jgi:hypothetical protein